MSIHRSDWLKRLILLLVIMLAAVVAMNQFTPPNVVLASAPPTEFSAERALDHLKVIAKEPHPMESPANAAVRNYLIQVVTAMGLQPEVQTTTAVLRFPGEKVINTGTVQNVIVRLKGTANTRAILLDGHYDSGDTGPGASDCGSCVVTLLETMRALKAGPPLKNDVIFVFADGEERGDLGAEAFASQHPWMKDVGVAINFEAQGSGGASLLYVTNPNNGWVVEQFLKSAPHPVGSSMWPTLFSGFKSQRPGCDLESYMARGIAGISFAYVGDTPAYHTMRDNVLVTDLRSIQQDGDYSLALVRHLGSMNLNQSTTAPDAVYFNILPGMIVHYSQTWAVPLAGIVGLLFLAVTVTGFRRKQLTTCGLVLGTIAFAFSIFAALALTTLVWWVIKILNSNYQVLMIGYYDGEINLLGLAVFSVSVMAALYTWLRSRLQIPDLATGALLVWGILMVLTSVVLPGVSYLFTWPLLFSLLALGWIFLANNQEPRTWQRVVVFSIAAVPGTILCIPAVYLLFPWMNRFEGLSNMPLAGIPTVFVALLMGLLIPYFIWLNNEPASGKAASGASRASSRRQWLVPGIIMLLSLAFLSVAVAMSGFSADHPRPNNINYMLNADSGKAIWVSTDQNLDSWTSQFFQTGERKSQVNLYSYYSVEAFVAPAPSVSFTPPEMRLLNDTMRGDERILDLRVLSPRRAVNANVQVEVQGEIVEAAINGIPLPLDQEPDINRNRLDFMYSALPLEGIELTLMIKSTEPVVVTVTDRSQGLPSIPGMTITSRPPDMMPAPGNLVDPTVVTRSFTLG